MPDRPTRRRAALCFGLAGLAAGAMHVLATEPANVRLWREVLPLALIVGAGLGAVFRPTGWRGGALLALLAVPVFALAYAVAETAMMAGRGELSGLADWPAAIAHWFTIVLGKAAIAGATAVAAGAVGGGVLKGGAK